MPLSTIAGVDEAGRGPWAGPVVAAAVILPNDFVCQGLTDSKKMSAKKRQEAQNTIIQNAVSYCVAEASVDEIDELNILQATFLAMKRAVDGLSFKPDEVWVDGHMLPDWSYPSKSIVQGDLYCLSISAASVLAKNHRDHQLIQLHEKFPEYDFSSHKGYGTPKHRKALEKYGPCKEHRKSFAPIRKLLEMAE